METAQDNVLGSHTLAPGMIISAANKADSISLFTFLREVYLYREYLKQSVLRDLRTKYKRSVLGYIWTMLHPLAMMIVLSVVFSHIMKFPLKDYAVFLFAGLLPWNYFNSTAMMSLGSIRANARLFSQIPVPKYIFIVSLTFSNLANYLFALVPLLLMIVVTGRGLSWTLALFPIMLLPLFMVTVGISLLLAAANVFFDDTLHLSEVGMNILYFLSPVLYARENLPPHLVKYLVFNPLFCQIEFLRNIFYEGMPPDWSLYLLNFGVSVFILLFALTVFNRVERKFLYFI